MGLGSLEKKMAFEQCTAEVFNADSLYMQVFLPEAISQQPIRVLHNVPWDLFTVQRGLQKLHLTVSSHVLVTKVKTHTCAMYVLYYAWGSEDVASEKKYKCGKPSPLPPTGYVGYGRRGKLHGDLLWEFAYWFLQQILQIMSRIQIMRNTAQSTFVQWTSSYKHIHE